MNFNLGIGTASPNHRLEVNGNICEDEGTVSSGCSDRRLKKNIKPINNAIKGENKREIKFFAHSRRYEALLTRCF